MTAFAFAAYGVPAPQGSKTRFAHGHSIESSRAVGPWREAVKAVLLDHLPKPWVPLAGPLAVRMVFTMAKPKGAKKTEFAPASKRNDLSKLARATEDACTDAGLWVDDGLVHDYHRQAKVWWGHDEEALPMTGVVVAATEALPDRAQTAAVLWGVLWPVLTAERERRAAS